MNVTLKNRNKSLTHHTQPIILLGKTCSGVLVVGVCPIPLPSKLSARGQESHHVCKPPLCGGLLLSKAQGTIFHFDDYFTECMSTGPLTALLSSCNGTERAGKTSSQSVSTPNCTVQKINSWPVVQSTPGKTANWENHSQGRIIPKFKNESIF